MMRQVAGHGKQREALKNEKRVKREVLLQAVTVSRYYWLRNYHIRNIDKSLRGLYE